MCSDCDDWIVSGRLKRREIRHSKDGPEEMPHRKKGGKNKWCGKKEGRVCEFTVKVLKWSSTKSRTYSMACPVCHKQKGYFTSRLVERQLLNGETVTYWT